MRTMKRTKETLTKALVPKLQCETVAVIHSAMEDSPRTVALVNVEKTLPTSEKLERAYMLTNSINDAWYTSDEVEYIGPEKACRSTSVGDMIRLENGKKFKCELAGWSEI